MLRISLLAVLLCVFALNCFCVEEAGKSVINLAGKTVSPDTHAILIPEKATPSEIHAAEELQTHLKLLTGYALPITKDDKDTGRNFFIVGNCGMLEKLGVKVDWNTLGKEGIFIKTVGPHLVLAGGQRGVLYACYVFLEEYLGVRWFTPDCMKFPKEGTYDISSIEKQYVPPLEYRVAYSYTARKKEGNPDWSSRSKLSTCPTPEFGGRIVYAGPFVHSFNLLVPPGKYFKEHPEYFAEVNGRRQPTQLCLSNPDVERIVLENVRGLLKKYPSANIVSVSQNDTLADYCQCPECKAVDTEEGSPSGSILRFVNRIAEQIEKEYPDVAIDTLAYNYSRKPPKITKPRANVIVRLCSISCSFSQPLETGAPNVAFCQDMESWGKICRHLYVWDYVTNFHHYLRPHPNLRVLKPNIQFFVKNGVKGVFEQGNAQSPGGEFDELRTYILCKLLWNPEEDPGKLMDEFLDAYYGPAAPYIRNYIDMIHDSAEKTNTYLGMYGEAYAPFFSSSVMDRADKLFDQAEEAVRNDPVLAQRVAVARLPVLYMHITGACSWRLDGNRLLPSLSNSDIEKFEKTASEAKVTRIKECSSPNIEEWLDFMKNGAAGFSVKTLRNPALQVEIIPEFGGRMWRMKYLTKDKDLIGFYKDKNGFQLDRGGYEEYSTAGYRSCGWNEKYEILEESSTKLVLSVKLKNDFQMTRVYCLDPAKPVLNITTVLTNLGPKTRPSCLRIHPVFLMNSIDNSRVDIKNLDGSWRHLCPADITRGANELWLEEKDMPSGEWRFYDGKSNLGIVDRFYTPEIGKCYLNWSKGETRLNMEMWSVKRDLEPGSSLTIRHSYEIVKVNDNDISGTTK